MSETISANNFIESLKSKKERVGYKIVNTQGLEMVCVEYKNSKNIVVEFKEPYYKTKSCWSNFIKGKIKNPYFQTICEIGVVGEKYPTNYNASNLKEYVTWHDMLRRVYAVKHTTNKQDTYKNCAACDEWLLYESFYEWVHSQSNFDRWLKGDRWCLDKDILIKGNKIYSPETCCLVPTNVNTLFVKKNKNRGKLPIGVTYNHKRYMAMCSNPIIKNTKVYLGTFDTPIEAFNVYKKYKEDLIKQVAQIEFDSKNITEKCYQAMLNYEVEITD